MPVNYLRHRGGEVKQDRSMATTNQPRSGDVLRKPRTHTLEIDSREHITHRNNNPWRYTVRFDALPNAYRVHLREYMLAYSPTVIITRTSPWYSPDTPLAAMSQLHRSAVDFESELRGADVGRATRVMTILRTQGAVSLNVVEVFTFERVRADRAIKTYDIFICTGTVATPDRSNWFLFDAGAGSISGTSVRVDTEVGATANYAETYTEELRDGESRPATVAAQIVSERIYLHINVGQGQGRLHSQRVVVPEWASFQVYRRGDSVCYEAQCYVCTENHSSVIFDDDFETHGYWSVINRDSFRANGAAEGAAHIIKSQAAGQESIHVAAGRGDLSWEIAPSNVAEVEIEWVTRRGGPYIFPHTSGVDFQTFEPALPINSAILYRVFRPHTLTLDIDYEEEVDAAQGSDPRRAGNFITSSLQL